jgi:hypothetical protein
MADQAAMSDQRPARPRRDASVSGDDPTYYVEKYESRWRVTYEGAPIGVLDEARDASRFACDLARMQAQLGRVTWVVVLAEVEEVHRFEMRAGSIKPLGRFLNNVFRKAEVVRYNPPQMNERKSTIAGRHSSPVKTKTHSGELGRKVGKKVP